MLAKRIIPCLDINKGRVVKGVHFLNLKDAGDPVENALVYEREGADELVFLDITASVEQRRTTIKLVRKVAENYSLPYYTITPTFSVCPEHGYISGKHTTCPTCLAENKNTECEVYSRVVGYLRPVSQWNKGKQQEFADRLTFGLKKTSTAKKEILVTQ